MKLEKYIIPRSLYVLNVLKWGFELHINHIGYSEVHGLYHKKVKFMFNDAARYLKKLFVVCRYSMWLGHLINM